MTVSKSQIQKKWKKVGKIGKAHGLKGAFYLSGRIDLWHEKADFLWLGSKPENSLKLAIVLRQVHKDRLLLALSSFKDRTSLEPYIGSELWLPVEEEVIKSFGPDDLVGLEVIDKHKQTLGKVSNIFNYGASDTIEIISEDEQVLEIPFVDSYFSNFRATSKNPSLILKVGKEIFEELWQTP